MEERRFSAGKRLTSLAVCSHRRVGLKNSGSFANTMSWHQATPFLRHSPLAMGTLSHFQTIAREHQWLVLGVLISCERVSHSQRFCHRITNAMLSWVLRRA